jgi:hypothetical protein
MRSLSMIIGVRDGVSRVLSSALIQRLEGNPKWLGRDRADQGEHQPVNTRELADDFSPLVRQLRQACVKSVRMQASVDMKTPAELKR